MASPKFETVMQDERKLKGVKKHPDMKRMPAAGPAGKKMPVFAKGGKVAAKYPKTPC